MLVEGQSSSTHLAGEGERTDTSLNPKPTHWTSLQSQWLLHFLISVASKLKGEKEDFILTQRRFIIYFFQTATSFLINGLYPFRFDLISIGRLFIMLH